MAGLPETGGDSIMIRVIERSDVVPMKMNEMTYELAVDNNNNR